MENFHRIWWKNVMEMKELANSWCPCNSILYKQHCYFSPYHSSGILFLGTTLRNYSEAKWRSKMGDFSANRNWLGLSKWVKMTQSGVFYLHLKENRSPEIWLAKPLESIPRIFIFLIHRSPKFNILIFTPEIIFWNALVSIETRSLFRLSQMISTTGSWVKIEISRTNNIWELSSVYE